MGVVQLQNEMVMGAWLSVQAETNLIFGTGPQYLWRKLFDRAEPAPVAKVARSNVPTGTRRQANLVLLSICKGQQPLIESPPTLGGQQC